MAKSTLKKWLEGNGDPSGYKISDSVMLREACEPVDAESNFWIDNKLWTIDVLDDGTAITYRYS
jgi:hypothetical protein